ARRPKSTIKYALTYYATKKLDFTIDGEYVGERYDQIDDQGAQTGKYNLVNFAANFKVNKGLTTYLKIDNLLNKEYQVVDGYATPKRSFFVGLNFKIK
ncbi:MAG: TonB-dependent receptor, partial [Campylobacterales bacterium]|nr:TonB-dependent receptor [Campylobacterales bacterium]